MLTKTERTVLKSAIKLSENGLKVVSIYEISSDLKLHPQTVINIIPNLVNSNLLKYVYHPGSQIPAGVVVTSYSQNLKEYHALVIKSFLASNAISILALIVAVIALFLPA